MSTTKQSKSKTVEATMTTKRFVIRQNLIGKGAIIKFTNNKGDECIYDHDKVYNHFKEKFDSMPCFQKYKNYTNSQNLPKFVRDFQASK